GVVGWRCSRSAGWSIPPLTWISGSITVRRATPKVGGAAPPRRLRQGWALPGFLDGVLYALFGSAESRSRSARYASLAPAPAGRRGPARRVCSADRGSGPDRLSVVVTLDSWRSARITGRIGVASAFQASSTWAGSLSSPALRSLQPGSQGPAGSPTP